MNEYNLSFSKLDSGVDRSFTRALPKVLYALLVESFP